MYVTDGLVAYWNLNEDGGITCADIVSANTGNLECVPPSDYPEWVIYKYGTSGLRFKGSQIHTDHWVRVPTCSNLNFRNGLTLECWLTPYFFKLAYPYISGLIFHDESYFSPYEIRLGDSGCPADVVQLCIGTQHPTLPSLKIVTKFNGTTVLQAGQSYHIVGTWSGTDRALAIWINGVQEPGVAWSTFNELADCPNAITDFGRDNYTSSRIIDGMMDEIRIYSRRLTEAEILQNYNWDGQPPPPPPGVTICKLTNMRSRYGVTLESKKKYDISIDPHSETDF